MIAQLAQYMDSPDELKEVYFSGFKTLHEQVIDKDAISGFADKAQQL